MAINKKKHIYKQASILRDIRPLWVRVLDEMSTPSYSTATFLMCAVGIFIEDWLLAFSDLILVFLGIYFIWLYTKDKTLPFKMPMGAKYKDKHNEGPGRSGKAEGILFVGNADETDEEIWFTNSDARTHILYLGTTGAGKTEGLKSMVTNALAWGSGFVYVDGKADTDLWSSLSALVRRFGRDDDLLVLNYMTGNSDAKAPSNTMNPFSSGSASYLTNMLVSLMPEAEGDNAMWKERAVSLASALMPVMTWKRDNQDIPMSVRNIRENLSLNNVIKLQRDEAVPSKLREGLTGYLDTLPGFVHDAYDDKGQQKPPGPDTPQYDTTTANQQHGYLAMQFTRSLQSLGDDYGYIFDTQAADVDMVDVVLNRRILVVLIPALEKSGDEIANLGKIVAATIKGMMGSALGATVEGASETVIENKPTHSSTPFMTVFDEVGYYTAAGMAVMAAQARSLGFSLIFSGQDLPAMKKRVREEANSITANCNIKIFGKLEDPTETKEFFEKTVGSVYVTEVSTFQTTSGVASYKDTNQASVQTRARASYDELRSFTEGEAIVTFGEDVLTCRIFYSNPGNAKAMRVSRFMALPPPDENVVKYANDITALRDLMVNKSWTAMKAEVAIETPKEINALKEGFKVPERAGHNNPIDAGITAVVQVHTLKEAIPPKAKTATESGTKQPAKPAAPATPTKPATATQAPPAQPTAPATPAAPAKPAEQSSQPPTSDAQKPATEKKAPMSFFTKGDGKTEAPAATQVQPQTSKPPATPSPQTEPPKDTQAAPATPASKAPPAQPPAAPPTTPAQPAQPEKAAQKEQKLPKEILDIIENAALQSRKKLFQDDDPLDAAE